MLLRSMLLWRWPWVYCCCSSCWTWSNPPWKTSHLCGAYASVTSWPLELGDSAAFSFFFSGMMNYHYPIPSMGLVYLPTWKTQTWTKSSYIPYMDGMGSNLWITWTPIPMIGPGRCGPSFRSSRWTQKCRSLSKSKWRQEIFSSRFRKLIPWFFGPMFSTFPKKTPPELLYLSTWLQMKKPEPLWGLVRCCWEEHRHKVLALPWFGQESQELKPDTAKDMAVCCWRRNSLNCGWAEVYCSEIPGHTGSFEHAWTGRLFCFLVDVDFVGRGFKVKIGEKNTTISIQNFGTPT